MKSIYYRFKNFLVNKRTDAEKVLRNRWQLAVLLIPLLVDLADFFLFERVNAWMLNVLRTPSVFSLWFILGIYVVYVIAIFFTAMLVPDIKLEVVNVRVIDESRSYGGYREYKSIKATWPEILFTYPTFGFGIIMCLLVVYVLGITSDKSPFSDDAQYYAIMGSVFIFFAHVIIFAMPLKPRFKSSGPAYLAVLLPTVIVCALVINLSVAAWQMLLADPGVVVKAGRPGKMLDMIIALPLFLLFFASPRFMFMSRNFSWYSLGTALLLIWYFVWRSLDYVIIF